MLQKSLTVSALLGFAFLGDVTQAQNTRQHHPIQSPIHNGGTLDWHTGKWKRSGSSFANAPGAAVIYNNTCSWVGGVSFGSADACEQVYDEGRIPTSDAADPINAITSLTGFSITFCGFNFSYCTGEAVLDMNFGFYNGLISQGVGGSCGGPYSPATAASGTQFSTVGLPASVNGTFQACWQVTIDLSNNANGGFLFQGNDDFVYTGIADEDLFGWSWSPVNLTVNVANPTGLFISGEPSTVITGGEGTLDIPPATDPNTGNPCGSGLDTTDDFWINTDQGGQTNCTTPSGCYSFGGYPGNPFASWNMSMFGALGQKDCTATFYCTAKPSGSGCLAEMSGDAGIPVSGSNNWSVNVSQVEGNRPGIFFTANTAKAKIPFQGSGTLCMLPPLRRGPIMFSFGGNNNCNGGFSQIINDGNLVPNGFDGGPGTTTFVQAWYRDPLVLDTGTALSNALEIPWGP